MYLAGELVSASECDYSSSKELGLICPICKSAVFLRSSSMRKIKGVEKPFRAYFAHYKGAPWDCENRVLTPQGRRYLEKLKIKAKAQRLSLYNQHLWNIIAPSLGISYRELNKARSVLGESWFIEMARTVRSCMKETLPDCMELVASAVNLKVSKEKLSPLEGRYNKMVAEEVTEFLSTDTAGYTLIKLIKAAVYRLMMVLERTEVEDAPAIMIIVVSMIGKVRWYRELKDRIPPPDWVELWNE